MKKAFTLAEVLITLGIIGIVASLTMPGVINGYKKIEYSTKIKRFVTVFSQSILQIEAERGSSSLEWRRDQDNMYVSDATFVNDMLIPKLRLGKVKYITERTQRAFFPDGSMVTFGSGACLDIIYDCNGNKAPNTYGADRFDFLMCFTDSRRKEFFKNKNTFFGPQRRYATRDEALDACKITPINCAGLLEIDNWEFKDDYPHKLQ